MRRQYYRLLIGMGLLVSLSGCGEQKPEEIASKENITVYEEVLEIPGLTEEFELLFTADNHVSLCDERDVQVLEKADARYESFRNRDGEGAEESFRLLMNYAKAEAPDLLILGGDVVDSAMWESIEFVEEELKGTGIPWMYGMGNHDFEYGSEYYTEKAYAEYLPRFADISASAEGSQIKEYDKFVVFVVDDDCNQVSEGALASLKELIRKEKPIILVLHVPMEPRVTNSSLWEKSIEVWQASDNGNSRVLLGPNSCVPNETTEEFISLVMQENSPVELVLAGHVHFYHRDYLNKEVPQVVTGAGYEKEIVKVTLVPEK